MTPAAKAIVVTVLFSFIGLCTLLFRAPVGSVLLPQLVFFIVLVINTFLSVRFYSAIQPENISQKLIDAVLVIAYLALALSLGHSVWFAAAALCLFAAAPVKYILMRGLIPHDALLRRKIKIDISGTVVCAAVLGATLLGYPFEAAWALAIVFTLANIYLLAIKPMYRL